MVLARRAPPRLGGPQVLSPKAGLRNQSLLPQPIVLSAKAGLRNQSLAPQPIVLSPTAGLRKKNLSPEAVLASDGLSPEARPAPLCELSGPPPRSLEAPVYSSPRFVARPRLSPVRSEL